MSEQYSLMPVGSPDYRTRKLSTMREDDKLIIPEDGSKPRQFQRKVIKNKTVKEVAEVKVPVLIPRVVDAEYNIKVPIKKLVEETTYDEVEEKYTDFEEKLEKIEKTEWVLETEEEEYTVKVPVRKTRTVKVPYNRLEEREANEEVEMEVTEVEEITGWRIDEVEDVKIVEVEEWEIYELVPTAVPVEGGEQGGEGEQKFVRELGLVGGSDSQRVTGTVVYKVTDLDAASKDGHNLDEIPVDYSQQDGQRAALFIGNQGYTSGFKDGDEGKGQYDGVEGGAEAPAPRQAPQQEKAGVSQGFVDDDDDDDEADGSAERFNLEKCLAYTRAELAKVNDEDLELDSFMEQLRDRWLFVDKDESGLVEKEELRLAVWMTEEDNAGIPMPSGDFPKALQDIVDEIWVGCGSGDSFTIWDFVRFMLNEQLLEHVSIETPPAHNGWAHAP